jgi:hypothetical protein
VQDDNDDCPDGFWLRLHYTNNILDVEAASDYLKDAAVYVYDSEGNYVTRIDAALPLLQTYDHRVRVEGLPEGDYQFVVWSGASSEQFAVAGDMQAMDKFRLSLVTRNSKHSIAIPDLFHGYLPPVHFDDSYAIHDVYMTKNTNQLSFLIVPVDENAQLKKEDYTMKIETANGTMDAMNMTVSDEKIVYEPFTSELTEIDDSDFGHLKGLKYRISTLRLVDGKECRLILDKNDTGETVFSISLLEYIGMIGQLSTNKGKQLSLQDYLDRQDFYTVALFLSGANLENLIEIRVNNWRLRANNHMKL